jgi:hypothetical protein
MASRRVRAVCDPELPQQIVRVGVQQVVQGERVRLRPWAGFGTVRGHLTPIGSSHLHEGASVHRTDVELLPHGRRELLLRLCLEGVDFPQPMVAGVAIGPCLKLEQMDNDLVQIAFD